MGWRCRQKSAIITKVPREKKKKPGKGGYAAFFRRLSGRLRPDRLWYFMMGIMCLAAVRLSEQENIRKNRTVAENFAAVFLYFFYKSM